ncbi:MAG: PatB family C-S lyase [Arenicellales bacterium]
MNTNELKHCFDEEIDRRLVPALKTHPIVLGKNGEDLFAAGVADMDFKAPAPVLTAMQQRLEHGVFGYEALPDGLMPALMAWLRNRHGWDVDEEKILRAPNVLNSLAISASLFAGEGDGVIVQPPVFFDFYDVVKENKRALVSNPLILNAGHYEIDFDGLERIASEPQNKMLFLCNPHNPVGRVWTREELIRLGNICQRSGVFVIADEIHGDITFPDNKYTPFASLGPEYADNSVTLISPAKSFNIAGCCSAFTIISNPDKRKLFQAENSRLTVNKNNAFASVAMEAAYKHGEPWLDAVIEYLSDNLNLVRTKLVDAPNVNLIEPEGTFLVWLDFRKMNLSVDELTAFLRGRAGWAVTRGRAFGEEGKGFARLNIACVKARLEPALNQLVSAARSL